MRKLTDLLLGVGLLLALAACDTNTPAGQLVGSGRLVSETRAVSGVTGVTLTLDGALTITQGDTESLVVEAEDNILPIIKTTVTNGMLTIGTDPAVTSFRTTKPMSYRLSVKTLNAITLTASGTAKASTLNTTDLRLTVNGSAGIKIDQLSAQAVHVTGSGSGDIALAGKVTTQEITLSGSGSYQAARLTCDSATAQLSGSGGATIVVGKTLEAHLTGSGNLTYAGSPAKVTQTATGSGRVIAQANQ